MEATGTCICKAIGYQNHNMTHFFYRHSNCVLKSTIAYGKIHICPYTDTTLFIVRRWIMLSTYKYVYGHWENQYKHTHIHTHFPDNICSSLTARYLALLTELLLNL